MRFAPTAAVFALVLAFAVPTPTLGSHAGPLTASCANPEIGYTLSFPNNWYYNVEVEGSGGATDIAPCRYFSPNDFSLTPGSEPTGVSIGIGAENLALDPSQGDQVTVGGHDAVRYEEQSTTPGFEGTYYVYRIALEGEQTLVARTSDRWVGDYAENKQILDAMMETLVFTIGAPPTPTATAVPATPGATELPDAGMADARAAGEMLGAGQLVLWIVLPALIGVAALGGLAAHGQWRRRFE